MHGECKICDSFFEDDLRGIAFMVEDLLRD